MAMAARPKITDDQLQGFKYFKKFLPLLDRLHDQATGRDTAHNRTLHLDQYIALQLVFFFNPIVTSMRGLVQASELRKVRKELGVCPTSLGSFSEAGSVFDAEQLKPIMAELGAQLKPLAHEFATGSIARNAAGGGWHGTVHAGQAGGLGMPGAGHQAAHPL
jgi:hypothetical protein